MKRVVLTDTLGNTIGHEDLQLAHMEGHLHRAFSVFVFDSSRRLLIQRRAPLKPSFPGLWSNSCCSHPAPGEPLGSSAELRLERELGFSTRLLQAGTLVYSAKDEVSGLTEFEYDHLFVGTYDGDPCLNPAEADDWRWIALEALELDLAARPGSYTPWFPLALARLAGYQHLHAAS